MKIESGEPRIDAQKAAALWRALARTAHIPGRDCLGYATCFICGMIVKLDSLHPPTVAGSLRDELAQP